MYGKRALMIRCACLGMLFACLGMPRQQASVAAPDAIQLPPPVIRDVVSLEVFDADGIALGDLTGNGALDILTSEGAKGATLWFEQGADWKDWTPHFIHQIDMDEHEIEGNALGDFNGDGRYEAVSLDQRNGAIYLHKALGDPRGEWKSGVIQADRPLVQDALVTDISGNGRPDLVYTWEGRAAGQGGVHWLEWVGGDPCDSDSWRDHVMTQHESAWWLAPRRMDFSGDDQRTDIVFTARHLINRNPGSRPGLFWMQPGEDVRAPWKVHTIDDSLPHPLHVDTGDLQGNGDDRDLVVGGFDTERLYYYYFVPEERGWTRHDVSLPALDAIQLDTIWNVKALRLGGDRDSIFVAASKGDVGAWMLYDFTGQQYEPRILRELNYPHPTEDRILLHDVTGDGQAELFLPDSGPGVNRLHILRLRRDW